MVNILTNYVQFGLKSVRDMLKIFVLALILLEAILLNALPTQLGESEVNSGRVIGGHEVDISKHPHQVSLRSRWGEGFPFKHACGGSIYKANIIITAAHCVDGAETDDIQIIAGTSKIHGDEDSVTANVSKIIMHEKYGDPVLNNDIALVFLEKPLPLNGKTMAPIAVSSKAPKDCAKSVTTGWGVTTPNGEISETLQEVEVPIVSNDRCDEYYAKRYGPGIIKDCMICAGVEGVGGKDACQGDSGGPLVVDGELAGIVSWGYGCAEPEYPGVYTNVAKFKKWIETNAKKNA